MSVDAKVDRAFITLLGKAQRPDPPPPVLPVSIEFGFDGVGAAPDLDMVSKGSVVFPARIIGCYIHAGNPQTAPAAATATFDLRIGRRGSWASGTVPLYGPLQPGMADVAEQDFSIAGWYTLDLQPGDLLVARLLSFSTSAGATWVTLSLVVRRLDVLGMGLSTVVSDTGDILIDDDGNTVVSRR